MSRAPLTRLHRDTPSPQAEVDKEIRHIRDLVFIRTLLSTRGATDAELREYDAEIDDARSQLAEAAKRAAARYAPRVRDLTLTESQPPYESERESVGGHRYRAHKVIWDGRVPRRGSIPCR